MEPELCPAQDWLDTNQSRVIGLSPEHATSVIEAAGLQVRVLPNGPSWVAGDLRLDRINLWLSEGGTVEALRAD